MARSRRDLQASVTAALDAFFIGLDAASAGGHKILSDEATKQWIETDLLRAFRRFEAARYHAGRVRSLVKGREAAGLRDARTHGRDVPPHPGVEFTIRLRSSSVNDILFEVDAFLGATRSCLDFAVSILARHLGMSPHTSMTKVLRKRSTIKHTSFTVLDTWERWISALTNYRDACTHHVTMRAMSGHEAVYLDGHLSVATVPVVLPRTASRSIPDTRASRHADIQHDLPEGLDRKESRGLITLPDGTTQNTCKIRYVVAPGYVRAERFCERHLEQLAKFLVDLLQEAASATFPSHD